jgi:sensor histidine kinase YesM
MEHVLVNITRRHVFRSLCYTVLLDTVIALVLTGIKFGGGFVVNFIVSQCIGISICSLALTGLYLFRPAHPLSMLVLVTMAIITGTAVGWTVGSIAAGTMLSESMLEKHFIPVMILGIMFGSIISYFFSSRERISRSEGLIQEERIKRLAKEKEMAETNLRFLQAQIEPHFLFNTLSNILSLLDADLEKGKSMLADFIRYLRTALPRTRGETTTIGQEMEMLQAYLNIFKVRMGDRLRYRLEIPESMKDLAFPPMLVQPLVENAIRHGLEPKIGGGELVIRGQSEQDVIRLEVSDTGLGLDEHGSRGIGISNIGERLQSLYGNKGRLILEENTPSGLKATIEVPHDTDQGDHSR